MEKFIRTIPDYPSKGVYFRHMGPLLADPDKFHDAIERLEGLVLPHVTGPGTRLVIAGLDARGFIIGTALATRMCLPFIMIRKESKLPGETYRADYSMEYGAPKTIELEVDALDPGDRVILVDDLLATGGTIIAASELVAKAGATVAAVACLIGLDGLRGRDVLHSIIGVPPITLYNYPHDRAEPTPARMEYLGTDPLRRIYVASENPDKIRAVHESFPEHTLYSVSVPSGVPEQPFGMVETRKGAMNRLELMMEVAPKGYTYVALENGIQYTPPPKDGEEGGEATSLPDDGWDDPYDFCVVVAKDAKDDGPPVHSISIPCPIPKEHQDLLEYSHNSKGSVTFGSLVGARLHIQSGSWHEYIGGMTRVRQMKSAIHSDVVFRE